MYIQELNFFLSGTEGDRDRDRQSKKDTQRRRDTSMIQREGSYDTGCMVNLKIESVSE